MIGAVDLDASAITAIAALLAGVSVGALIKIVNRFLRHIEEKDDAFTKFLGNHMSKSTAALDNVAAATREMLNGVEQLHEDNLATARQLLETNTKVTADLDAFEERVRERHRMLADRLAPKTRQALREVIDTKLD